MASETPATAPARNSSWPYIFHLYRPGGVKKFTIYRVGQDGNPLTPRAASALGLSSSVLDAEKGVSMVIGVNPSGEFKTLAHYTSVIHEDDILVNTVSETSYSVSNDAFDAYKQLCTALLNQEF